MKAVGLTEFGRPEVLKVLELPEPQPGAGEVRIKVHAVAVNPTDITFRTGGRAAQLAERATPYIPDMDVAGVIDKLGSDVDGRLAIGESVIAYVIPTGPHGGTYAEQVVVGEASVVRAPRSASFAEASTLLLNATTAPEIIAAPGDDIGARIRRRLPCGAPGRIDTAVLGASVLPAVAYGGGLVTLKGWAGPSERGIVIHAVASFGSSTDTELLDRLRRQVEEGILTLRLADVLPARKAAEAHRRLATGGVRGRLVLDFTQPL
jgi:NADPH:quinone reductase